MTCERLSEPGRPFKTPPAVTAWRQGESRAELRFEWLDGAHDRVTVDAEVCRARGRGVAQWSFEWAIYSGEDSAIVIDGFATREEAATRAARFLMGVLP